jgi:hypothetical protein
MDGKGAQAADGRQLGRNWQALRQALRFSSWVVHSWHADGRHLGRSWQPAEAGGELQQLNGAILVHAALAQRHCCAPSCEVHSTCSLSVMALT